MTISGGEPAATAVGYFWKNVSHGMPSDRRQTSGLSVTNFSSRTANTAPSVPVRPCHKINGSEHSPNAFTIGVGSSVGALGSTVGSEAAGASVASEPEGAFVAVGAAGAQVRRISAISISKVRLRNNLLRRYILVMLLSFSEN